jgi:GNAT superfamily N-acetyltransferase
MGKALVIRAIERARARGCRVVQLTSDLSRVDARHFYESLGFSHTHAGMKLAIGAHL